MASSRPPLLAPVGTDKTLLPDNFLGLEDDAKALLETCGRLRVWRPLLSDHVFPAFPFFSLGAVAPRALDAAFAALAAARASWTGAADGERR